MPTAKGGVSQSQRVTCDDPGSTAPSPSNIYLDHPFPETIWRVGGQLVTPVHDISSAMTEEPGEITGASLPYTWQASVWQAQQSVYYKPLPRICRVLANQLVVF